MSFGRVGNICDKMRRILMYAAAVAVLLTPYTSVAMTFTRCGLAAELRRHGVSDLRNWVCMAESESALNTNKLGRPNRNGDRGYGIFQINNKFWCKDGRRGGDCNINCEDLRDNNIADDIECAKKIHRRFGFSAWYGWRDKCQSHLPDLSKCRG